MCIPVIGLHMEIFQTSEQQCSAIWSINDTSIFMFKWKKHSHDHVQSALTMD